MTIFVDRLIQCVPNFSEGRDHAKLDQIANAIQGTGVRLVDWSADVDHNRSVFTFVGSADEVKAAAITAAEVAVRTIDIRKHDGVHPRLGALDVLPFVPLNDTNMEECISLAHETGGELARKFELPVFYYDFASNSGKSLPEVRKEAFTGYRPDIGPASPHQSAGATAIGARFPLVAFNVNLVEGTLKIAKQIAIDLRLAFPNHVRALGLYLPSRNVYQVSMNIIRPETTSLVDLADFIRARSEVSESELIGVMPGYAAFSTVKQALKLTSLKPDQVLLETWNVVQNGPREIGSK